MKKTVGFIMTRHVNNVKTNQYWIHSYNCIRKYYPENVILIIDDNSDYKYITNEILYKTTVVQSEYPKRGELLPYYYYLHVKLFDIAVIIHDSIFINKYIDFNVTNYKIMWDFEHYWDQIEDETKMIKCFNDEELLAFYENKSLWKGCFGAISVISHKFLQYINTKYDIHKLLDFIVTRSNRSSFERVLGCLLQKECKNETMFGDISKYIAVHWHELTYEVKDNYSHLPIIKVFTGR
jgi:hypothetical protein